MDPKANLAEIRRICEERQEDGDRLVELIAALDEWITGGGFSPWEAEQQKRRKK